MCAFVVVADDGVDISNNNTANHNNTVEASQYAHLA